MTDKLQRFTGLCMGLFLISMSGCPSDNPSDPTTTAATMGDSSGGPGATGQNPTGDDSSSGDDVTAAESGAACPIPDAGEAGAECSGDCGCLSEQCFVVGPLGGVCSSCNEDADCAETTGFGCNFGNPLNDTPAVCSETGTEGEGCETSDTCADGLVCNTLIEVAGIISASTCSECSSDAECSDGQLCAPTYDIENIAGFYRCVDPMSVPLNEGCDIGGSGNEQCESGNCAPAGLTGIPVITVCSECNEDSDCMDTQTCQLPEVAVDEEQQALSLVPGMCVDA